MGEIEIVAPVASYEVRGLDAGPSVMVWEREGSEGVETVIGCQGGESWTVPGRGRRPPLP